MQNHLKMQDTIISGIQGSWGIARKCAIMESVGLSPLVNPIIDRFNFVGRERVAIRGHLFLGVCAGNILIHKAFGTVPR